MKSVWLFLLDLLFGALPTWLALAPCAVLAIPTYFWARAYIAEQRLREADFKRRREIMRSPIRKGKQRRKGADKRG